MDKRWIVLTLNSGNDVALECEYKPEDFETGFPKIFKGQYFMALNYKQSKDGVEVGVGVKPVTTSGGFNFISSEKILAVAFPDSELCELLGNAVGRQSIVKPSGLEVKQVTEGKRTFESLKGGK